MSNIFLEYQTVEGLIEKKEIEAEVREIDLSRRHIARIDLSPLKACKKLESLDLSNNPLYRVDPAPLSKCKELWNLELDSDVQKETFLSRDAIKSFVPNRLRSFDVYNVPLKLYNLKAISFYFSLLRKNESRWKLVHLFQSAITVAGFGWMGYVIQMDYELLKYMVMQSDLPSILDKTKQAIVELWRKQIDDGCSSIGTDIKDVASNKEIARRISKIIDIRNEEMKQTYLHLSKGIVDLRPLWITAYGYDILKTLGYGLQSGIDEIKDLMDRLVVLGYDLSLTSVARREVPSNISQALREYIWMMIKYQTKMFPRLLKIRENKSRK